ncbi:hypothetical protein OTK49_21600 [Vibrio coralliirubri]|uniref:hypothetical protein n=1 Tax=Vibrio coralliirubri TaxID=1516159 RepID=UPI0022837D2B|nr:hypothetical protein [Vibrio coralliirubri]MCY9865118.1 hypothetical protein [Vibrio coralliirubri]
MLELIIKNAIAAAFAFAAAFPLLFLFDIAVNGYYNPQYGVWSQTFLNGSTALAASGILGVGATLLAMGVHSKVVNAIT